MISAFGVDHGVSKSIANPRTADDHRKRRNLALAGSAALGATAVAYRRSSNASFKAGKNQLNRKKSSNRDFQVGVGRGKGHLGDAGFKTGMSLLSGAGSAGYGLTAHREHKKMLSKSWKKIEFRLGNTIASTGKKHASSKATMQDKLRHNSTRNRYVTGVSGRVLRKKPEGKQAARLREMKVSTQGMYDAYGREAKRNRRLP